MENLQVTQIHKIKQRHPNSTYPKNGGSVVKPSFILISKFVLDDSEVLRNRHLWVVAKHYRQK